MQIEAFSGFNGGHAGCAAAGPFPALCRLSGAAYINLERAGAWGSFIPSWQPQ